MINFKNQLLLFSLFGLISFISAQNVTQNYLYKSHLLSETKDNFSHLNNFLHKQRRTELGTFRLDSIHTISASASGSETVWLYNFDKNGKLNFKNTKVYFENKWNNSLYFIYTYDTNENLLTILTQYWEIDKWVNDMHEAFTYDEDEDASNYLTQFWINDEWINHNRALYFYDSNKNLEILLFEDWKDSTWISNSRLLYTYQTDGTLDAIVYEQWNENQWEKLFQSVYIHNDNNKLVNTVISQWDGAVWQYYLQAIFEYDLNSNLVRELVQLWNGNDWQDDEQYFYEYNSDNYFTYGRSEKWDGTEWEQFDGMFSFTNPDGFTEHLWTFEAEAYYTPTTDVNDEISEFPSRFELFQNYPNPFNPTTTIKYSIPAVVNGHVRSSTDVILKVYDILGREVVTLINELQKPGSYEIQFAANNLTNGSYFYRLQCGSFVQSKKMILLK